MKTNAQLQATRASEARAQTTLRQIKTTYYTDSTKNYAVLTVRSMHRLTAARNCIRIMEENHYGAMVAEAWDESRNEVLVIVKRNVLGDVKITRFFDPITGEKLRDQPHEVKLTEAAYTKKLNKHLGDLVNAISDPVKRDKQLDLFVDQIEQLRLQFGN